VFTFYTFRSHTKKVECSLSTLVIHFKWQEFLCFVQWRSRKFSGCASICNIPFCPFPFSCPTKSAAQSKNTSYHIPKNYVISWRGVLNSTCMATPLALSIVESLAPCVRNTKSSAVDGGTLQFIWYIAARELCGTDDGFRLSTRVSPANLTTRTCDDQRAVAKFSKYFRTKCRRGSARIIGDTGYGFL